MGVITFFKGLILTPAQWQSLFDAKQDLLGNPGQSNMLVGNGSQWQPQTLQNVQGLMGFATIRLLPQLVDFNAGSADTVFPVALPPGFTRYRVDSVRISGATHTLVTATAGLFTAAAGGGVVVVTGGSAITVSATAEDTNNNAQAMTVIDQDTRSLNDANLYFRVATAEGAAAKATVTIVINPLS